jgi:hypothetical protein
LPCDCFPDERHELPPALLARVRPEIGAECIKRILRHAALFLVGVEQRRIRPGKHFLPAQAVDRDEEHIARCGLRGATGREGRGEKNEHE